MAKTGAARAPFPGWRRWMDRPPGPDRSSPGWWPGWAQSESHPCAHPRSRRPRRARGSRHGPSDFEASAALMGDDGERRGRRPRRRTTESAQV